MNLDFVIVLYVYEGNNLTHRASLGYKLLTLLIYQQIQVFCPDEIRRLHSRVTDFNNNFIHNDPHIMTSELQQFVKNSFYDFSQFIESSEIDYLHSNLSRCINIRFHKKIFAKRTCEYA